MRVEEDTRARAIERLASIVGAANVLSSEENVARFSRCTIPFEKRCLAVVRPASAEEVSRVVRACSDLGLEVWPYSRGHNWGYGTTVALHEGAVVVLLDRLDRILHVDRELAYALVEPGVSQKQLNDHLRGTGLWTDCTDSTPDGSIVGNALDRGVGYTPYGDHFGAICGLEVVLPDGEIVRTGSSRTWNTYKWGVGPYLEGAFTQSNFGIVTKAGIWLMPEPEAMNGFVLEVEESGFEKAIDAVRRLALHRTISNVHCVNDFLLTTTLMQYPFELREQGAAHLSLEARRALYREHGVAPLTVLGGLYGTREQVRAHRGELRRTLGPLGKLAFFDDAKVARSQVLARCLRRFPLLARAVRHLGGPSPEMLDACARVFPVLKGIPTEFVVSSAYFKRRAGRVTSGIDPARDGCGLIWFAPVVPATGKHASEVRAACESLFESHGFELGLSLILVNPRSLLALMPIYYDKEDAAETARARELHAALADATDALGYQQYRTGVSHMSRILGPTPGLQRLANAFKAAIDPGNVIAPGRYGVGLP